MLTTTMRSTTNPHHPHQGVRGMKVEKSCGGHGVGETPGTIPNPEAKPHSADGTAPGRVWESRTPPQQHHTLKAPPPLSGGGAFNQFHPHTQHTNTNPGPEPARPHATPATTNNPPDPRPRPAPHRHTPTHASIQKPVPTSCACRPDANTRTQPTPRLTGAATAPGYHGPDKTTSVERVCPRQGAQRDVPPELSGGVDAR